MLNFIKDKIFIFAYMKNALAENVVGEKHQQRRKQFTETIAKSCLYTAGLGVNKARMLWANEEPGLDYDDLYICTQGSNKTNLFETILDYLNQNIDTNISPRAQIFTQENDIILYPNPTSGLIKVVHNFNAGYCMQIDIYDSRSAKVKTVLFNSSSLETTIDASLLSSGMYYFIVYAGEEEIKKGKLTIIK